MPSQKKPMKEKISYKKAFLIYVIISIIIMLITTNLLALSAWLLYNGNGALSIIPIIIIFMLLVIYKGIYIKGK